MSQNKMLKSVEDPQAASLRRRAMSEGWGPVAEDIGLDFAKVDPRMKASLRRIAAEREAFVKLAYVAQHYIADSAERWSETAEDAPEAPEINDIKRARQLQKIERDLLFVEQCLGRAG